MKLLRAFAVLFLFPFFSQSQFPVSPNKLDEKGRRTGHWTLLFDSAFRKELKNPDSARYYRLLRYEAGIPTGKVRDFYRTGQKQWEGYLLSMIPDVIDVEGINYHENGKVKYKAVYVKGKFDGPFAEYSVNGKLLSQGMMKEDSAVGKFNYYREEGYRWLEIDKHGKQREAWTEFHANGQLKSTGYKVKDKIDGLWLTFYENGNRHSKTFYTNDLKNGAWEWYNQEGVLEETGSYLNDKQFGNWTVYNDGGKTLLKKGAYDSAGKETGHWAYYFTNGNKKSEGEMLHGSNIGDWRFYYEDGTLKVEGALRKGLYEGEIKMYKPNGKLESIALYERDTIHGAFVSYYDNGNVLAKGKKNRGNKDGLWSYYFEGGALDGTEILVNGTLLGKAINFYPDGKLKDESSFIAGNRDSLFISYFYNGEPEARGFYKNGKRTGAWVWYYDNGKIESNYFYTDGLFEGAYVNYFINGKIKSEGTGLHGKKHGPTKYYFANGQLKSAGNNTNDLGEGIWNYYDSLTAKKTAQGLLVKNEHQGKWNYWTAQGKKEKAKYYFLDWQEEPYNIRDSIYALVKGKQFDKAWEAVSWEKKVIKREYPKEHKSYALPFYLYGYILLYGKAQAQQALPWFQEYRKLVEKYEGRTSYNYRSSLNDLANAYSGIKQYERSLVIYDTLMASTRKLETDKEFYLTALYNKGITLYEIKRKNEADSLFTIEIKRQISEGKDQLDVMAARKKEADFHYAQGNYEKAIPLFKNLMNDMRAIDAKNKMVMACAYFIAYCNQALSHQPQAIWWFKHYQFLAEENNIPSFLDYQTTLSSLANQYNNANALDSALQTYTKILNVITTHNLLNTRFHSDLLDGRAGVYRSNSENQKALTDWIQAKTILEKIGDTNTGLYSDVLCGLGLLYNEMNKPAEAVDFYTQGLALSKQVNGETSRPYLQSMVVLATIYTDQSAYDKGIVLLDTVLNTLGDTPNAVRGKIYVDALNAMADIKRDLGQHKESIQCNERALNYFEKNMSENPFTTADLLRDMSISYRKLADYENAERLLLKALGIIEKAFGTESITYLNFQISLAYYYNERSLYSDAVKVFQQIMAGFEKSVGKNNQQYFLAVRNLASCYFDQGEYQKAEGLYIQFRDLILPDEGTQSNNYLNTTYKLATINFNLGKRKAAESLYKLAAETAKQFYGETHPSYASFVFDLANFYFNVNQLSEAEPLAVKSSSILAASAYGKNSKSYASHIILLGKILSARNKNKEAEGFLTQAVAIMGVNKEDFFYTYLDAAEALADFYEKLGQFNRVEKLRKEVIALVEGRSGKDFNYATKNLYLLSSYYSSDKFVQAINLGNDLLTYFEGELSRDNYLILDVHNLMGLAELDQKNFDAAAKHFKYCLEMRELNSTKKSAPYATSLNNLSVATLAKGDFAATEDLLIKAAALRKELDVKLDPRAYAIVTDNYASLYQAWGKLDKAEKYWLDVIQNLLTYTRENFYFMSDEEKSQFWKGIKSDFEYFNTFAVLRAPQNPAILGEMYNNQLATKAILLSASNKIKKRILTSKDTAMVNHYYHWMETREKLAQLYTSSDSELKNKKQLVDSLETISKNSEKELNISAEDLAQDKGGQSKLVTWKEVQRALLPTEAAIEIIRYRHYDRYLRDSVVYAALVLTAETKLNPKLVVLPNGKLLEGRALRYYKNAITAKIDDQLSYTNFWAPLDAVVKNKTRIYLSLDGVYNQINLNTLADADGKFLVESKNLTILSNTKDLLQLKGKRASRFTSTTASLFGYPKYFMGKARIQEKLKKQKRDVDAASIDELDATGIAELPGTQTEIAQIKNILASHHWQTNYFTDENASEKELKAVDYPRVLHIATHGFFVDENESSSTFKVGAATEYARQNPLLRSGLLLSGASNFIQNNVRLEDENGILTAYEAANLNLDNTDLVVLSACETGKGEVQNGEGVYGLQRAFQSAGAQAIIMSLWKVDDEATQELMTAFYQNWMGGATKAEAFRQAQLQLKGKYTNPYYWGAFVMMGN